MPPPPTETAIKAAQERHQKNLETDKILEEARQQRSQEIAEQNRIRLDKKERADTKRYKRRRSLLWNTRAWHTRST